MLHELVRRYPGRIFWLVGIWRPLKRSRQRGPRLTGSPRCRRTPGSSCQCCYERRLFLSRTGSQRRSGPGSLDEIECNLMFRDAVCSLQNRRLLSDCVHALRTHEAVDTAIPSADTVIRVRDVIDTSGLELIDDVPPRQLLRRGQTLRCFRLSLISRTHDGACRTPMECAQRGTELTLCTKYYRNDFKR